MIPDIFVGEANGSPRRLVQAYLRGQHIYTDTLDTDNAWARECYAKKIEERLHTSRACTADDLAAINRGESVQEVWPAIAERIMQLAAEQLVKEAATEACGKEIGYRRYTCRELDNEDFVITFLVAWILVSGQPCIVAGGKKTLKTNLLIALAIALATAEPFLGKFKVDRAVRVMMMSGESGMATIQETARRIAKSMDLELSAIGNLIFSPDLPRIGNLLHHDALEKMLRADEIEVLILDPVYLCLNTDGNESSLFAMGDLLREVSELCQKCGVTLILAHHTKKTVNDPFAPPELEHIAWSGFAEFARQWILIGRREPYEPGTGEHRLWMNVGGSAGHSSCWALDVSEGAFDGGKTPRHWAVELMRAEEARQDADSRKEMAKVVKANEKHNAKIEAGMKRLIQAAVKYPNGETKSVLFDTVGMDGALGNLALAAAIEAGAIVPCEIMKGNQKTPREGYKLRPDEDSNPGVASAEQAI
jgi:hypothetical protein